MNSQELQESGRLPNTGQLPRKRVGRPKGSKNSGPGKPAKKSKGTARKSGVETPAKHSLIYSLHLAGEVTRDIARKADVVIETVRVIIAKCDKALVEDEREILIDIVRDSFVRAMDNHKMITSEHTISFVHTQLERDKAKTERDRQACEVRLRTIGRELISANKAFVDILCRMGVPQSGTPTTNGSHTDSSTDTNFYDTLSIKEADVLLIKTVEKQLTYLKGQKKQREKEKSDE